MKVEERERVIACVRFNKNEVASEVLLNYVFRNADEVLLEVGTLHSIYCRCQQVKAATE